jgi:hypothetical protein
MEKGWPDEAAAGSDDGALESGIDAGTDTAGIEEWYPIEDLAGSPEEKYAEIGTELGLAEE